jgi:DUF4097 and DUF4098 domain-containing protein YvlB
MHPKAERRSQFVLVLAALILANAPVAFAAEGHFERTLQVNGPVNLQVETGSGSIHVRSGGSNDVRITGHIRANNWLGSAEDKIRKLESNPPIQQSGNDIRIGHIDDPELRHDISISYEIETPANTQLHSSTGSGSQEISGITGQVEANTGSGSVRASDLGSGLRAKSGSGSIDIDSVKGSVYARAGSGSIRATNVAGGFDGETGSGHLELEQSGPGSVRAGTGSGGVELRNVHGSLEANAGSGSIKAEGDATGEWRVRTGSGSVQLHLPKSASFDLNAHTGSGRIDLNHPVTVQGSIGRKEVRGRVGNGGVPVQVETGSGNIIID